VSEFLLCDLPKEQRLTVARALACQRMPYFRSGLLSLIPVDFAAQASMAVTRNSKLLVNYDVLGKWTAEEAATMLLHMYLHIFFRHAERADSLRELGLLRSPRDLADWGIATECVVNSNIKEASLRLPCTPDSAGALTVRPHYAADHDLPSHLTAEAYFSILRERRVEQPESEGESEGAGEGAGAGESEGAGAGAGAGESEGESEGEGEGEGANPGGWGQCGSGAGNPIPGEPLAEGAEDSGRSPAEQELQRRADVASMSRFAGKLPRSLRQFADALSDAPKIPWTTHLETATRRACAHIEGRGRDSFVRRSRYQSSIEAFFVGKKIVLPGTVRPQAKIALVVDTSSSMDGAFTGILAQAKQILRTMRGATLLVVACDTVVHAQSDVRSVSQLSELLIGGGGTDFRPAFAALARLPARKRPSVIVFATDGRGAYPPAAPNYAKTIWLVVAGGRIDVTWGERVCIEPT